VALNRTLLAQRHLAMLICVAALAMKLLVPAGYMLSAHHGRISVTLCAGVAPSPAPPAMTAPMAGMHDGTRDHERKDSHGQVELPCAFAGLAHQALAAADPILLAAAIAYIVALGVMARAHRLTPVSHHLRPYLRGPPTTF
jgi:hypothetical protein